MDSKIIPKWQGKSILDAAHHGDLETRAAIHEFQHGLPRQQAESKAYEEYVKDARQRAAAHHLDRQKAADAVGDKETAFKHNILYRLHLKALGLDEVGPVPPEVQRHIEDEGKKSPVKFKAHPGDLFALQDESGQESGHDGPKEDEPVEKSESEGHTCQWRLGERRCKNPGSRKHSDGRRFCHHHLDHWANRIPHKEENTIKSEVDLELYELKKALDLKKPGPGMDTGGMGPGMEGPVMTKGDLIEGKFPQAKSKSRIPSGRKKAAVLPLAPKLDAKRVAQRQAIDSMLHDVGNQMASDPGMQAAARQREVERKAQQLKRGPQKFQPGHRVVISPESTKGREGSIPADWVGTVGDHHDQMGTEWSHDGSGGPHHMYNVQWKTPKGELHDDYVHQDDLSMHPGNLARSEIELELEAVRLAKGDIIPFPIDRVTPAKDLGENASVVEHPHEAIARDLREAGIPSNPKLMQQIAAHKKGDSSVAGLRQRAASRWNCKQCGNEYRPASALQAKVGMCENCHPKPPVQLVPPMTKSERLMKFNSDTWTWEKPSDAECAAIEKADEIRYAPLPPPEGYGNQEVKTVEVDGKKLMVFPDYKIGSGEVSEDLRRYIREQSDEPVKQ